MRRIALAMGPVIALVAATVPAIPAHSQIPARSALPTTHVTHARTAGLATATRAVGATYVSVSWNWIKAARGYQVQVARHQDFSDVVSTRTPRNATHRPPRARPPTTVGHLRDGSYYWARVRKLTGTHAGTWSAPTRVATRAHVPDPLTVVKAVAGPSPGETTIKWATRGGYTDLYRITTALTAFGTRSTPKVGRHSTTFTVRGGFLRHVTLTPQQTAAAGAGLGTGRHLFFRINAVRQGVADSQARRYPYLMHTAIRGQGSTMSGTQLRYAAYNLHVQAKDAPGHPWRDRQHLIARSIARFHPAVLGAQELMPAMWTDKDGGVGLWAALKQTGVGSYRLARDTAYWPESGQDTRILYDATQVQMTSACPTDVPSCYIPLPDPGHKHVAAYARFRDLASGQEFWFVSAHLTAGNDAKTDALRARQAEAIDAGIRDVNRQNLPVVFAADSNSAQTSKGAEGPHSALVRAGWYDTIAARTAVHTGFNSVNRYSSPERPSNWGFGAMYDVIMTLNMPGADRFEQVLTGAPWPSDHNMIYADVRLP
jgi:endonuclease/exonuclease/phosphatase family metal-dependent hydrolase